MTQQEKILYKLLEEVAKKNNYSNFKLTVKPVSSGGANYSSNLFAAKISAPERDDLNLFAKVAAAGEQMRESIPRNVYTNEHYFYEIILKKYREIEEKYNIKDEDRLITAQFYEASSEHLCETLILENLAAKGFKSFNRLESINWPYASSSIKNLAVLHALSIAYSKEDPIGYAYTVKSKLTYLSDDFMAGCFPKAFAKALDSVKGENKARLAKFLKNPDIGKPLKRMYKAGPVIIHSDYRPSNMMHKVKCETTVQVIVLDFQTLNKGCPAFDLLNFLLLGSDKHFREQYLQMSLDLYYQELSAALRRFNLDACEIYNKETYQQDIEELLPYVLSWCLYELLVVTVDESEAPGMNEDLTDLGANIRPNKLYIERINDLVDDFITMGFM